jgi:hypothetical protein
MMVSHVKTPIVIALSVLMLAAIPAVALAANGPGSGSGPQARLDRIARIADRFAKRCGTSSVGAPQKCIDFANKALDRLQALDAKVQEKLPDHPRLQRIDTTLQSLISKLQGWLGSSG